MNFSASHRGADTSRSVPDTCRRRFDASQKESDASRNDSGSCQRDVDACQRRADACQSGDDSCQNDSDSCQNDFDTDTNIKNGDIPGPVVSLTIKKSPPKTTRSLVVPPLPALRGRVGVGARFSEGRVRLPPCLPPEYRERVRNHPSDSAHPSTKGEERIRASSRDRRAKLSVRPFQ